MNNSLRLVALAALSAAVLTTTACSGSPQPAPSQAPVSSRVYPAQGYIQGINATGAGPKVQCTQEFVTVTLVTNGTTNYNGSLITTKWSSDTVTVTSAVGFKSFVAGFAVGEGGTNVPFSLRQEGMDAKATTLTFNAKEDFAKVADGRIVTLKLCAIGM